MPTFLPAQPWECALASGSPVQDDDLLRGHGWPRSFAFFSETQPFLTSCLWVGYFSQVELSRETLISERTLSQMIKGTRKATADTLRRDLREIITALYRKHDLESLEEAMLDDYCFCRCCQLLNSKKGCFFALSMAHVFQTILSVDVKEKAIATLISTLKMVHSAPLLIIDATGKSNGPPPNYMSLLASTHY